MRVLPANVVPIFLGRQTPGGMGSQICYFDVYYNTPPVVGFDVAECIEDDDLMAFSVAYESSATEAPAGFDVQLSEDGQAIIGFVGSSDVQDPAVSDFEAVDSKALAEGIAGLQAYAESEEEGVICLDVSEAEQADSLTGFFVESEK